MSESKVAIIDIGSNAVRLAVYDGLGRAPFRIHSERIICNLGADLGKTGLLQAAAVSHALTALRRISALLAAMKVGQVRAVATAAAREAGNGREFIERVRRDCGLTVEVLDGDEEARLSALGVFANGLCPDGVIGDYGGGSLELIEMRGGEARRRVSLPLGSHRLLALRERSDRVTMIKEQLESADFLKGAAGDFCALGGAWRSIATAHMHLSRYPLKILDHYAMEGREAARFAGLVARRSLPSLGKVPGMSKKRQADMGVAALALEMLLRKMRPERLVFSGTGLREGVLFDRLPAAVQRQDALLAACEKISLQAGRAGGLGSGRALYRWLQPVFAGQDGAVLRLLEASCLLSDLCWLDQEDYRAELAFQRTLTLPLYGASHADRAFLALAQHARYGGAARTAEKLLERERADLAVAFGLGQRLAAVLTGGEAGLLKGASLAASSGKLTLRLEKSAKALLSEAVSHALKELANSLGLAVEIAPEA